MIQREHDFDDVLILPQTSHVNHRDDVDLSTTISKELSLRYPIMASPMKEIVGTRLINQLADLGGMGFLHRFHLQDEEYKSDLSKITVGIFGAAIALNEADYVWKDLINSGASIICVDVANGYIDTVLNECEKVSNYISSNGSDALVMGGNVVTLKGCERLYNAGCKFIRVGIGSGQLCTTRNATGIGRPQISSLLECGGQSNRYYTIADGGIRNSGDAAKALAAGADFVMMGSWFAQAIESEHDGEIYGMASAHHQMNMTGSTKSVEGIKVAVEKKAPLQNLMDEFTWNLRSAFTYVGAKNIPEFQAKAQFVEVSTHAIKKDITDD